ALQLRLVVLLPVRDDWTSAAVLVRQLDHVAASFPCSLDIWFVDDGSVQEGSVADFQCTWTVRRTIRILRLPRNLGPPRASAIALAHLGQTTSCHGVLAMDADGEDTPAGALELVHAFAAKGGRTAIFAARSRRVETFVFRIFYWVYRAFHRILTGIR